MHQDSTISSCQSLKIANMSRHLYWYFRKKSSTFFLHLKKKKIKLKETSIYFLFGKYTRQLDKIWLTFMKSSRKWEVCRINQ